MKPGAGFSTSPACGRIVGIQGRSKLIRTIAIVVALLLLALPGRAATPAADSLVGKRQSGWMLAIGVAFPASCRLACFSDREAQLTWCRSGPAGPGPACQTSAARRFDRCTAACPGR